MKTKTKPKVKLKNQPDDGNFSVDPRKTILVVYGPTHIDPAKSPSTKRYPFNTTADLRVGDILTSNNYSAPMHVVDVLPYHKYINIVTGELSNTKASSTNQREVRPLIIQEAITASTIVANIIKRKVDHYE